jgi:type II secretory pathway pseudopilin PulG
MSPLRPLHNQRGVSLLVVLVIIVVMGLSLGTAGMAWKEMMQREREEELFFRGDQYRRAIESYYGTAQKGQRGAQGMYPNKLEDLLKDPRSTQTLRHLRRLYKDPMTGADFEKVQVGGEITGLPGAGQRFGGIKGVRSTSTLEPFRVAGFKKPYESFNGAGTYHDWEFVYTPEKKQPTQPGGAVPPVPGTAPQPGGTGRSPRTQRSPFN